jgi:hypothetical protein
MTNLNPKVSNPGLEAGRDGRNIGGWVNGKSGIATKQLLTDDTMVLELEEGKRYVICLFYLHLHTLSDWVAVEWGTTVNADGSGAFTAYTPEFHVDTGNVQSGSDPVFMDLGMVPLVLTAEDGGAWACRAQANDADATAAFGFYGWWEYLED